MRRAINVLCLAGMVLALVPIAVSWVTTKGPLPSGVGRHVSVIDIMDGRVRGDCPCLLMSATIFATATVFLLVSPLGALFQIAGLGVLFIGTPTLCIVGWVIATGLQMRVLVSSLPALPQRFP
jgi:hypothetical protein